MDMTVFRGIPHAKDMSHMRVGFSFEFYNTDWICAAKLIDVNALAQGNIEDILDVIMTISLWHFDYLVLSWRYRSKAVTRQRYKTKTTNVSEVFLINWVHRHNMYQFPKADSNICTRKYVSVLSSSPQIRSDWVRATQFSGFRLKENLWKSKNKIHFCYYLP